MYPLEDIEEVLETHPEGREILNLIYSHGEEVMELINTNREVMVTWQKNKGPAFIGLFMKSLSDPAFTVPGEVEGIKPESMLRRMAAVLQNHGSPVLRNAINKYYAPLIENIRNHTHIHSYLESLQK